MKALLDRLSDATPLGRPLADVVVIVVLFFVAWLMGQIAVRFAAMIVDRTERRRPRSDIDTAILTSLRQRETAIGLIATSIRYLGFVIALVLSIIVLSGAQRLQTILGASFLAVVVAFAAQRFLTDVVAGLLMFFEGWFRVGDSVSIDVWQVQGVVESASLRSLTIRSIQGEIVHVPNSQVVSLRVFPRGYRQAEIELLVTDIERGRELVREVVRLAPLGPTRFVRPPELAAAEALDDSLHRLTIRCTVAVGRDALAEDYLPALLAALAPDGLLFHKPLVLFVDDVAARSFARSVIPRRPPVERPSDVWPTIGDATVP